MEQAVAIQASDFQYVDDCIDIIYRLVNEQGMGGVIVTMNKSTRDFSFYLEQRGVILDRIQFIDCVSIISGAGTPPIKNCIALNNPFEYENILFYTLQALKKIPRKRRFVIFISSRMFLDFDDFNEVGVFFEIFIERMKAEGILCVVALKFSKESEFGQMIGNLVDDVFPYEEWMS